MPPQIEHFYKNNQSVEKGPPLELPQEYIIMDAMFEWNITLEEWRGMHVKDKAKKMAYIHTKRSIESYISDWYRKQTEDKK